MPPVLGSVYRIATEKRRDEQTWFNTYIVDAASLGDAEEAAQTILEAEQDIHGAVVEIVRARISSLAVDGRSFESYPFNQFGSRTLTGQYLPGFLAVRVDMTTGFNDPLRKFYHCWLTENDQDAGILATGTQADIVTALAPVLAGSSGFWSVVDKDGTAINTLTVYPRITSHQFRRKWARRA